MENAPQLCTAGRVPDSSSAKGWADGGHRVGRRALTIKSIMNTTYSAF